METYTKEEVEQLMKLCEIRGAANIVRVISGAVIAAPRSSIEEFIDSITKVLDEMIYELEKANQESKVKTAEILAKREAQE